MKNRLKIFVCSICVVAVILGALAGCASKGELTKGDEQDGFSSEDSVMFYEDSDEMMMQQSLTDDELENAAEKYKVYFENISEKFPEIWSGTDDRDYHVVITNGSNSYYVSKENYEKIDASQDNEMKNVFQMLQYAVGMYQPVTYKGENITAMHLMKLNGTCTEDDFLRNFVTLMHESFHLHTQSKWQSVNMTATLDTSQSNMRASDYPIDEKPRIFRAMQYKCLYSALNSKSSDKETTYLEEAKFWYEKWVKEYPNEYSDIKDTDLSEGTAEYFGNEIKQILQGEKYNMITPEEFAKESQSADAESYNLGDVAIQLLKKRGEFKETDFAESGKPPVEVLMEKIENSRETDINKEMESIISDNITKINAVVSEAFSDYIKADLKGETTYIGIKSDSLTGIMSEGFYYLLEIDKTGWQNASISNTNIQVNSKNVLEYGDSILIPVMESEITKDNHIISDIKADGISLNTPVKYEEKADEHGNTIYQIIEEK